MPILPNPRRERFATELARGKTTADAYRLAGYKYSNGGPYRLRRRPDVAARVEELRTPIRRRTEAAAARREAAAEARVEISIEKLTAMLIVVWRRACALEQMSAAVAAVEKLGKLHGFFVDRAAQQNLHYVIAHEPVTDVDEWLRRHKPAGIP